MGATRPATGYQLVQSIYAIAGGGLFGAGLGRGVLLTPEGNPYIPFLQTDFIYSAIAQELGLAGAAAVILLYLIVVYRGFRIAMLADDGFSKLLAAGLTTTLALQAFIIVGGVTGLIPLTGITLPFVSYGGSSIVANFLVLWLLLAVSNRVNARAARPMNPQIRKLFLFVSAPVRRAHRRLHVLALALARPRGAAGQPDARRAPGDDQRGLIYASDGQTVLARNRPREGPGPDVVPARPTRHGGSSPRPSATRRSRARGPGSRSR